MLRAFKHHGPVAQLDRALPSEGKGRTFESSRVRHSMPSHRVAAFGVTRKEVDMTARTYVASVVPRFIRTSRLGYVPMSHVIGSRLVGDGKNATIIYDILMLPEPEFARARMHAGMQHVIAPTPHRGETMPVGVIPSDVKRVTVPDDEADPFAYAKAYFLKAYGIDEKGQAGVTTA